MWETISSILLKYWVEFLLGLFVAGATFFVKRYLKLDKADRAKERQEEFEKLSKNIVAENNKLAQQYKEINQKVDDRYVEITENVKNAMLAGRAESKADDEAVREEVHKNQEELNYLKAGLLSMQGKEFKENCRRLLDDSHVITLDEWEEINADHEAYNGLGGNHRGDELFNLVRKKAENKLTH